MSTLPDAPADLPVSTTMAQLRRRKREATQALLGDTIAISDAAWQEPSRLAGWTRAHVATHLARSADGMRRVTLGLLTHSPALMYPDESSQLNDIEAGSQRGALDLQIDLDTSAGLLNDTFNYLEESGITEPVELRPGRWMPAHHLPVARLQEVVMHHVDLDCGFAALDVDGDIARWLLEWTALQLAGGDQVEPMLITSHSGFRGTVGRGDPVREVTGHDAALWGWLTGRGDDDLLQGTEGYRPPIL